jgi:hypothetical protein
MLLADLEALIDPVTRGDPESPLRWTSKSTRALVGGAAGDGPPGQRLRGAAAAARGRLDVGFLPDGVLD